MLAATRLAFLAAFGVVLGGRTARALDLKGLGFDPAKSLNMAAAMLPVVCNANEQQKTDMECAGCIYSISEFLRALARAEEWAITMTDALVKPPAGILGGTFSFLSSFDDCLGVPPANTTDAFLKRAFNISTLAPSYCSFKISVGLPDNDTELHHEPPQGGLMAMLEKQKGELKDVAELLEEFPGFLGLCLPSACTVKSLKAVGKGALFLLRTLGAKPPNVKLGIEVVDCVTKDSLKSHEQSATVLAALIVVGVLVVLVLLGTLADTAFLLLVDRELSSRDLPKLQSFDIMSQNSYVETLRCFSAYRNFRLLMSGRHPSKTLRPLVGISSMSFLWVVIGNTLVLRPYNLSANLKSLREYLNDPMIQFALNSSLAVDAIATALGITITYNIVQLVKRCDGFEKCRALTYIKCTLNAMKYFFAGLLPMYMILLLVINAKFPSAGTGPTWTIESQRYLSQCEGGWMWNVLFINNFFPTKTQCMPHTWFLAFVFQALLFCIAMGFLLVRLPKFALAGLGVVIAACSLTTFLINNANDLGPTALLRQYRPGSRQAYHDSIAVNFYTRGGPFCIGMIVGYVLALRPKMRLNRWVAFSGWLIALGAILAITHTPWFWNKEGRQMSPGAGKYAAYDAFHRVLFSAGVSYMAVACAWGSGGVINAFLSWSGWLPISKLCFAVYILNPFLIFYFNGTTRGTIFYTVKLAAEEILWNLLTSLMAAVPIHLLFESPFLRLAEQLTDRDEQDGDTDSDSMGMVLQEKVPPSKYR
ncbi:O-acyltransferase like protein [Ixodes scapularis]|uniref:O-acyltransferase like protein n=1 Tax=Ixodes scapularis TaxID=6945 RepID=UPI001A9DFAE5|nr:O-acyltransferase like protein [Ixodes scapularis]